mgnify:CR=1 FL=1
MNCVNSVCTAPILVWKSFDWACTAVQTASFADLSTAYWAFCLVNWAMTRLISEVKTDDEGMMDQEGFT